MGLCRLSFWGTLLLAGCAATSVSETWRAPNIPKPVPIRRVLVGALLPGEAERRNLEEALAEKLCEQGLEATPSFDALPEDAAVTPASLRAAAFAGGYDVVWMTNLAGDERDVKLDPGMQTYNPFDTRTVMSDMPEYVIRDQVVLKTQMFDMSRRGELLWSATSVTSEPSALRAKIPGLASVLVSELEKDRVVSRLE